MLHKLTVPISAESIAALQVGDQVQLSGLIVTARDAAHKLMIEKFVRPPKSWSKPNFMLASRSCWRVV